MRNTTTLKSIASQVGVSISTVSKALNDSYEISKSTKKKVLVVAKTLNYKPNFYAKNLKKREKFIFGVILPSLKDDFYLDILIGITEESFKRGHLIMVYQTNNKIEKELSYTQLLSGDIIDGLIFSSINKENNNEYLKKLLKNESLPIEIVNKKNQMINPRLIEGKILNGVETGKILVNRIIKKINYKRNDFNS